MRSAARFGKLGREAAWSRVARRLPQGRFRPRRPAVLRLGRRGGYAIEFAVALPVLLLVMLAGLEFGSQQMTASLLDSAAREAARFGAIGGGVPPGMEADPPASREEAIRRIVLRRGAGWLRTDNLDPISITAYGDHGSIGSPAGSAGAGLGGQVVVYELVYRARVNPVLAPLLGRDAIVHRTRTVVRNEPFDAN